MMQIPFSPWVLLFFACLIAERLVELVVAKRNRSWIVEQGGKEYGKEFSKVLRLFHVFWFASFLLEAWLRPAEFTAPLPVAISLFVLLQAFRYWCIVSLGKYWNVDILVLPGASVVSRGPYRFLKHPNYVVVVAEILLYPLLLGCVATMIWGSIANVLILRKRIRQEEQALAEAYL